MTIIELLGNLYKKKVGAFQNLKSSKLKITDFYPILFFALIVSVTIIFFSVSSFISKKNLEHESNFKQITHSNDFSNLTNFFISKINSPYNEIKYSIRKNDTIEKILKNYNIRNEEINSIAVKLRKKKAIEYLLW